MNTHENRKDPDRNGGHAPRGGGPSQARPARHEPVRAAAGRGDAARADAPATGVRLNRYIASTGYCSRRAADELVAAGRVMIDGRPAGQGDRVMPGQRVSVDGHSLRVEETVVCLMLHKPVRVVSTARDPQGRRTVLDFVPDRYRSLRLYPVGRLDYFSEGLLLLTNDGALAQRLTHPSHNQSKVYRVLVRGEVSGAALDRLRGGMRLAEGDVAAPCEVTAGRGRGNDTVLTFTLHQGLNRQIRRMCRDTGLTILRLRRVAEGPLALGDLPAGAVRELSPSELRALKS